MVEGVRSGAVAAAVTEPSSRQTVAMRTRPRPKPIATGVFLGYDCVGKEQYQPDAERVRFILAEFLPRLRVAGLDEADAQALVVVNPAGFLTWRAG
jgi:predicted metal-dependent phosphotriesterase family hydrolase